jgi:hypothetical protein
VDRQRVEEFAQGRDLGVLNAVQISSRSRHGIHGDLVTTR